MGEITIRQPQDTKDQAAAEGEPDASARLATALLARGAKSEEEPPESVESEPGEEERIGRGGKPVVAWRNGRAVIGVGS